MSAAYSGGTMTWEEELMNLVDGAGIRYSDAIGAAAATEEEDGERQASDRRRGDSAGGFHRVEGEGKGAVVQEESVKDQVAGFLSATGELVAELGRGCWNITQQSLEGAESTYVGKRVKGQCAMVSRRLGFLNDFLPEDRDPTHAWPVVVCVFSLALIVLSVSTRNTFKTEALKKLYVSPPSANRIQLPDGRYIAYLEQGVAAVNARFSMIAPHSFLSSRLAGIPGIRASLLEEFGVRLITYDLPGFLSSRLAGIPGIRASLLEEFGVRLITYDLPGFGESDPHPGRNLTSSALDMHHLANALGVVDKFWVVGYSSGGMHAWAALHHIPGRIAGAAMFAPVVNPYDSSMNKEERHRTWEKWTAKRKLLYLLARKFPSLLPYVHHRSFFSGRLGRPEKWLSLSLGEKDKSLLEDVNFNEFWEKNVAESVRQGNVKPFVEEAMLQVSSWGFNLADLQVKKQPERKGLLLWLKSLYRKAEYKQTGFLGPIHIWQGMDDKVVPSSVTEFIQRMVPQTTVQWLPNEGHFSYFCFCDDCHRQIFSTLFGVPQGPLQNTLTMEKSGGNNEEVTADHCVEEESIC